MRYTIEREKEVRALAAQGKSSSYISSKTNIPERVIWNWCPETRPHDDVIKWSVKQRYHSIIPELEARISAAVSPIVRRDITEDEWESVNQVINKTLFEEAIIVFKNLLAEPPEFGSEKRLSKEPFLDYLRRFWSEDSEYVKRKGLKSVYIKQNHDSVHYWSLLKKRSLSEVNSGDIERVFENLSAKGLSQSRVNGIMKTGLIPLKEAYKQGLIPSRCHEFYLPKVEKSESNLSFIDISKIFNTPWKDYQAFIANLIAYYGKMQLQEVRALRICDIFDNAIRIENCYTRDGLMKNKNPRTITISSFVSKAIICYASTIPYDDLSPCDYIFQSESRDRPSQGRYWNEALQEACKKNGIKNFNFRMWSCQTIQFVYNLKVFFGYPLYHLRHSEVTIWN